MTIIRIAKYSPKKRNEQGHYLDDSDWPPLVTLASKNSITALFLIGAITFSWGQTTTKKKKEGKYFQWQCDNYWPSEMGRFYDQDSIKMNYDAWDKFEPNYLAGDFDGDNKTDYALAVFERKTSKNGIIIFHSGTSKYFILGAGKPFNHHDQEDHFSQINTWQLSIAKTTNTEAILITKMDSSSGLIYWTGQEYKWMQLGD